LALADLPDGVDRTALAAVLGAMNRRRNSEDHQLNHRAFGRDVHKPRDQTVPHVGNHDDIEARTQFTPRSAGLSIAFAVDDRFLKPPLTSLGTKPKAMNGRRLAFNWPLPQIPDCLECPETVFGLSSAALWSNDRTWPGTGTPVAEAGATLPTFQGIPE
jgi:hypothetical protein